MGFCCRGFGWGGWMGWGGGWIGLLLNLALFAGVLILLGLAAVWIARQFRRTPSLSKRRHSYGATATTDLASDPLEIARRRLAAGEITVAEFEDIRDRLRG